MSIENDKENEKTPTSVSRKLFKDLKAVFVFILA